MTFRIINPNWKSGIEQKAEANAAAVAAWLKANEGDRYVTLSELRAGLPEIAADLTRAVVNQICALIGVEVEGADDSAA